MVRTFLWTTTNWSSGELCVLALSRFFQWFDLLAERKCSHFVTLEILKVPGLRIFVPVFNKFLICSAIMNWDLASAWAWSYLLKVFKSLLNMKLGRTEIFSNRFVNYELSRVSLCFIHILTSSPHLWSIHCNYLLAFDYNYHFFPDFAVEQSILYK